jgi:hypothetical protein
VSIRRDEQEFLQVAVEEFDMADARRCLGGRGHPALLTCLVLVATVVVLFQHACNSNGQAYSLLHSTLVARPANSALSKLDVLTPTKERPHTVLTQSTSQSILGSENVTTETRHINSQDVVIPPAPEPVEPEALQTHDAEVYNNGDMYTANGTESVGYFKKEGLIDSSESMGEVSVTLSEQNVAEKPNIRAETESPEVAKDDVTVAYSVALNEGDGLRTPSELVALAPVSGSVAPQVGRDEQDGKVMEPASFESSAADANQVQQKLVEAEPEVVPGAGPDALESSGVNHENLGNLVASSPPTSSPIASSSANTPVQVSAMRTLSYVLPSSFTYAIPSPGLMQLLETKD